MSPPLGEVAVASELGSDGWLLSKRQLAHSSLNFFDAVAVCRAATWPRAWATVKMGVVWISWILVLFPLLELGNGQLLDFDKDKMEITDHLHNYIQGSREDSMYFTLFDAIGVYAGTLPPPAPGTAGVPIRKWTLWGTPENIMDRFCRLNRIYNYGETAVFHCLSPGSFVAFATDAVGNASALLTSSVSEGTADNVIRFWYTNWGLEEFDLSGRIPYENKIAGGTTGLTSWEEVLLRSGTGEAYTWLSAITTGNAMSDPFEVREADFCYYWNYRMMIKSKVGYLFSESDHLIGTPQGQSYMIVELDIWISEATGISESERNSWRVVNRDVKISGYSKILTKRFQSKGLEPCLRDAHPAIEQVEAITFYDVGQDQEELKDSPHWKAIIKIHTNTIVSTLQTISFSIASRQHISLFYCFVEDLRVFLRTQSFSFIPKGVSDRSAINWEVSSVPATIKEYLKLRIRHIYGHTTAYMGSSLAQNYQDGEVRTDLVVIQNPCIIQEFAIAVAGKLYIAEEFLTDFERGVTEVVLPSLSDLDADGTVGDVELQRRHNAPIKVKDVAFTPTHIVLLVEDTSAHLSLYLHSHSAYHRGLAYLPWIEKTRLSALVKRRWCGRSNIPKTVNMIVPGFSDKGNIVIIQIYPVEKVVHIDLQNTDPGCVTLNSEIFSKSVEEIRKTINESCIHRKEAVKRSDDRGLSVEPDLENCGEEGDGPTMNQTMHTGDVETKESFAMNQGMPLSETDPHFPQDLRTPGIYKIDDSSIAMESFNKALLFHIDRADGAERKIPSILEREGLIGVKDFTIHDLEFTEVENKYAVAVQFTSDAFLQHSNFYKFVMFISTISVTNMPSNIYYNGESSLEETLNSYIPFPGVLLVRSQAARVRDEFNSQLNIVKGVPYVVQLYVVNKAVTAYLLDLGNVLVYTSIDAAYARPLTYFKRNDIHEIIINKFKDPGGNPDPAIPKFIKNIKRESVLSATVAPPTPADDSVLEEIHDVVVTEEGFVSALRRRRYQSTTTVQAQSVLIGSILTLEGLREVQPFSARDKIFQLGTPDGHIVYGKYQTTAFPLFSECDPNLRAEIATGDFSKVVTSCLMPDTTATARPLCAILPDGTKNDPNCEAWVAAVGETDLVQTPKRIGKCPRTVPTDPYTACIVKVDVVETFRNDITNAQILGIPFHGILNGNLEMVPEEKLSGTKPPNYQPIVGNSNTEKDRICPFANFDVNYVKYNFMEVGFKVRITAEVSYFGVNVPTEADLLIEYERIPGIKLEIDSSVVEDKDQVTLKRTIDVTFSLSDVDAGKMSKNPIKSNPREKRNVELQKSSSFTITIQPSIINMRCTKEDFFSTIQYRIGCYPFAEMRFMSEAAPVVKRTVDRAEPQDGCGQIAKEKGQWERCGDHLYIPRDQVWHKQRTAFDCEKKEKFACKIPYAYLFEDNIFELSWRDPLVPKFEEFLTAHSRRVTGNIIIYDLFGFDILMNITSLDAGCYHKGGRWYSKLLESATRIPSGDTSEQEDVYQYFVECFDPTAAPRDKPHLLAISEYRLLNATNYNRIRFDIVGDGLTVRRTKNRNQFLLLRAAVINTEYNRFTYCQLMDSFFLIRIVGLQAPRQGLPRYIYAVVILLLIMVLAVIYVVFSFCYTWKLDVANLDIEAYEEEDEALGEEDKDFATELRVRHTWKTAAWKLKALKEFEKGKRD